MNEGVAGLTMPSQLMERGDSNENGVLSSPSSPEFLLPAFESNLQLSSSPILDQTEACADDAELQRSERPTVGRLRRFSRGQTIKKAARSPNRGALQHDSQALLDTADVRKFKKAEQRLTQSVHYLSKKCTAKSTSGSTASTIVTENVVSESASQPSSTPTSPAPLSPDGMSAVSPSTTPSRRSRFSRAFTTSPVVSPNLSPSSPRTPQVTPRSRNGRRWSQALHAIMSPSPSLPRTSSPSLASVNDIAWAEATNSSPSVSSTEVSRWEMTIAIESTRSAQSQLLKTIRDLVAKLDDKPLEDIPEMKECVLFLAQFMHCGGQVPDTSSLAGSFDRLHSKAVKLCKSLARLRSKDLSFDAFDLPFKQQAILCHCLTTRQETDTDVFGLKSPLTKNDTNLVGNLRHFVSDYARFTVCLREFHTLYRLERRNKRRERRLARIDKAAALFSETGLSGNTVSAEAAEIATLSTQELLQHALNKALGCDFYSTEEVEAFDPRVMLTLPRLALFYGVRQSAFPKTPQDGQPYSVPMEVFLPRICRNLPYQTLLDLRCLSDHEACALASRLAGVGPSVANNPVAVSSIMDNLFRTISAEANAGSSNSRDPRSNKLLSRALALHLSESTEDFSMDDDSTISKAYIMLMGLTAS